LEWDWELDVEMRRGKCGRRFSARDRDRTSAEITGVLQGTRNPRLLWGYDPRVIDSIKVKEKEGIRFIERRTAQNRVWISEVVSGQAQFTPDFQSHARADPRHQKYYQLTW
jgi:hypothetical protein